MSEKPAERKSAGQMTWLWMIVSIVVVAGFLAWLAANSTPSSVAVMEEAGAEATPAATNTSSVAVTLADLQANIAGYVGQTVHLEGIEVTSPMGTHAFWTSLPNGQPFLVKLDPALVAGGFAVAAGDAVTVTGRVVTMTDSVIGAWQAAGAITNEGQKAQAEFATEFVEAVEATAAPADARGAGEAGAEGAAAAQS